MKSSSENSSSYSCSSPGISSDCMTSGCSSENTTGAPSIPCANAETAQKNKTKNITIKFFINHLLRTDLPYRPSLYKRKVLRRLRHYAEFYMFLPEFSVLPSD